MPQFVSTPWRDYLFIPCVSLFANRLCIYTKVERYVKTKSGGYHYATHSLFPKEDNIYNNKIVKLQPGLLSKSAQRNIRDVVSLLVACSSKKSLYDHALEKHVNFKVNFITLTLSSQQRHSDTWIVKNMLEPFLRAFRAKCPGLLYIWKAEKQDNGNLHFHITSNRYINLYRLREMWNSIQCKHAYLDWQKKRTANSTDVHAVRQDQTLAQYLCSYVGKKDLYKKPLKKYFAKYGKVLKDLAAPVFQLPKNYFSNIKSRPTCKLWDCSKVLKSRRVAIEDIDNILGTEINYLMSLSKEVITTDYVTIAQSSPVNYYKTKIIKKVWFDFTASIRKADAESVGIL